MTNIIGTPGINSINSIISMVSIFNSIVGIKGASILSKSKGFSILGAESGNSTVSEPKDPVYSVELKK